MCAPSQPKRPTTLPQLNLIPIRILEPRCVTPGELEDVWWPEIHSALPQSLESRPAIFHLNRVDRTRLTNGGSTWPQSELEVLALDADGQESRCVTVRIVAPLLEADDIRVVVERLVLIANQ